MNVDSDSRQVIENNGSIEIIIEGIERYALIDAYNRYCNAGAHFVYSYDIELKTN
jgi:hypothetical protein